MSDLSQSDFGRLHFLSDVESYLCTRGREIQRALADVSDRADPTQKTMFAEYLEGQARTLRGLAANVRKAAGKPIEPDEWWKQVVEGREG